MTLLQRFPAICSQEVGCVQPDERSEVQPSLYNAIRSHKKRELLWL